MSALSALGTCMELPAGHRIGPAAPFVLVVGGTLRAGAPGLEPAQAELG